MPGCETNFFKVNRKIFESDIWLHPDKLRIFLYLLGQARWKSTPNTKYKNYGIVINRGQYLRSLRKLQGDLEYFYNNALKEYSLSTLSRIISQLEEEERITTEKTELGTLFTVCNYHKYQKVSDDKGGLGTDLEQARNTVGTGSEQYSKKDKKDERKEEDQKVYAEIINYLNQKADKQFKPDSKATVKKINGRLDEGYELEDFKHVIDVKTAEWKDDPEMNKYLRPQTLFAPTKFEGYLNEKVKKQDRNYGSEVVGL